MKKNIYNSIGRKIYQFRTAADLSQEAVATSLGISRASIANYEAGNQEVSIETLYKIAYILKKRIVDFLPSDQEIIDLMKQPTQKIAEDNLLPDEVKEELSSFFKKI